METKEIAIAIRENLIKEMELRDKFTAREKRYWNRAFEVGKEHPHLAELFLNNAHDSELNASIHNDNVRHLRYALHNMLEMMGISFDTFHPETAEF